MRIRNRRAPGSARLVALVTLGAVPLLPSCDDSQSKAGAGKAGSSEQAKSASGPKAKAEKAATIAKEIKADPSRMDAVLERHAMTRDELEVLLFEIAEDAASSEAYAAAMAG